MSSRQQKSPASLPGQTSGGSCVALWLLDGVEHVGGLGYLAHQAANPNQGRKLPVADVSRSTISVWRGQRFNKLCQIVDCVTDINHGGVKGVRANINGLCHVHRLPVREKSTARTDGRIIQTSNTSNVLQQLLLVNQNLKANAGILGGSQVGLGKLSPRLAARLAVHHAFDAVLRFHRPSHHAVGCLLQVFAGVCNLPFEGQQGVFDSVCVYHVHRLPVRCFVRSHRCGWRVMNISAECRTVHSNLPTIRQIAENIFRRAGGLQNA